MYEVDQYTVSLLHFDEGIKDECGRTWISNNASVSTDQKVFGNSSLSLDVGKYIYTDNVSAFNFTGEFTIDMWAMFTQYPTTHGGVTAHDLFSQVNGNSSIIYKTGGLSAIAYDTSNMGTGLSSGVSYNFKLNTWYHLAVVSTISGANNIVMTFINGNLLCYLSRPTSNIPLLNTTRACIGKCLSSIYSYDCIGYIDEFRISNIARWTSSFSIPEFKKSLLIITMVDGVRLEYELMKPEIDSFITWYNNKAGGSGAPYFTFNKSYNLTSIVGRNSYLVHDKIVDFDVIDIN